MRLSHPERWSKKKSTPSDRETSAERRMNPLCALRSFATSAFRSCIGSGRAERDPTAHHEYDISNRRDVARRIAAHGDQVALAPRGDLAEVIAESERAGGPPDDHPRRRFCRRSILWIAGATPRASRDRLPIRTASFLSRGVRKRTEHARAGRSNRDLLASTYRRSCASR